MSRLPIFFASPGRAVRRQPALRVGPPGRLPPARQRGFASLPPDGQGPGPALHGLPDVQAHALCAAGMAGCAERRWRGGLAGAAVLDGQRCRLVRRYGPFRIAERAVSPWRCAAGCGLCGCAGIAVGACGPGRGRLAPSCRLPLGCRRANGAAPGPGRLGGCVAWGAGLGGCLWACRQYSGGKSLSCALVNTGPSLQTYILPTLHRPHLPKPHFMRFSSVV